MDTSSEYQAQYEQNWFLSRLIKAHGMKYVLLVISVYGINQGAGEGLTFFAQQYWLTDPPRDLRLLYDENNGSLLLTNHSTLNSTAATATASSNSYGLGLSPSRYAEIDAVTNIPWQIKALYGVLSDVQPIRGLNKTPYMIIASSIGVISFLMLWESPVALSVAGSALLLLLANFSIASPDVMIDGSIAEKSSEQPVHAADLQSLCWISFGIFKIISLLAAPYVFDKTLDSRTLFGWSTLTALAVMIPSCLGWMGEKPSMVIEAQLSCMGRLRRFLDDPQAGPFIRLAFLMTFISIIMGIVSMRAGDEHHFLVSFFATFVVTPLTCWLVYKYESQVDTTLAKFSLYIFLSGAIQPSTPVLFYWMKQDDINCSWNLPCFSPEFIANLSIVGYVFFVIGTWMYNRFLTKVTYKKIYIWTQLSLFVLNMIDLFWVKRLNLLIGLSDEAFVLGDEVISPMISRWNTMPMMVLTSVLCPPGVFSTFFALNMGLSNFGGTLGEYFGIGLMVIFKVNTHEYEQLPAFIVVRSLFRLVPIALIPLLLPDGSPDQPPAESRFWEQQNRQAATAEQDGEIEGDGESMKLTANTIGTIGRPYTVISSHEVVSSSEMVSLTKS
jgi:hypothetical protein